MANNILTLRGSKFTQEKRSGGGGSVTIPKGSVVKLGELENLHNTLMDVKKFWKNNTIIDGALVSVYYNRIVAKSNRIGGYLRGGRGFAPNDTMVGAKFNGEKNKHITTHYVPKSLLDNSIKLSSEAIYLFKRYFPSGSITESEFSNDKIFGSIDYKRSSLSKSTFKQFIRDACFVEKFGVEQALKEDLPNSIVSFYNVNTDLATLLAKINIEISPDNILDSLTVLMDEKKINSLLTKAPYLVSMAVEDFTKLSPEIFHTTTSDQVDTSYSQPLNEPVIGVIDSLFDQKVYFGNWVDYHDLISNQIDKEPDDYIHGTAVTSLVVDAPNLNKNLDDGCGRFRVRHFGVSLHDGFNSFSVIKQIKEIVSQNTDIKVWNLSLGSDSEIRNNFISAEAATLDSLQFKYDIIFVIAGTNGTMSGNTRKRIGSPADSLNSLVVNSVDFDGKPVNYTRRGIVLSFFVKPDISYYGGGNGHFINVCEPLGLARVAGTSYAAPLVARKLAYLIHIIGLSREEAKALLVDSAIKWNENKSFEELSLIGNGIVPINIKDILSTPSDEIKFIVSDISEKYNSYNYNFPVPVEKEKYPYVAKATMCYFPNCSRNQGVDYTNTELNLLFGRLTEKGIRSINKDRQNTDDDPGYIREVSARGLFRKWDNIKHITETFTPQNRAKSILNKSSPQWGMSIKTIERLHKRDGKGIKFGVVVTLKEINGINRIEDFINRAQLRGWLVTQLRVEERIDTYNKLSEEIKFE